VEPIIDRGIAELGADIIIGAVRDLSKKQYQAEALGWFNERSIVVGGYGWCLFVSGANPNAIRKIIVKTVGVQS